MTSENPQQPNTEAPAEDGARVGGRAASIGRNLDSIMALTGLTSEQIRQGFRADPPLTLAEQALAEGVGQNELVAVIVADIRRRVHEAVAAGQITQQQADERLVNLEVKVTDLVTTIPFRPAVRATPRSTPVVANA